VNQALLQRDVHRPQRPPLSGSLILRDTDLQRTHWECLGSQVVDVLAARRVVAEHISCIGRRSRGRLRFGPQHAVANYSEGDLERQATRARTRELELYGDGAALFSGEN